MQIFKFPKSELNVTNLFKKIVRNNQTAFFLIRLSFSIRALPSPVSRLLPASTQAVFETKYRRHTDSNGGYNQS